MAFTEDVFSGIERGPNTSIFQYVWKKPGYKEERAGQFMRTWFATAIAIFTTATLLDDYLG